MVFLLFVSFCFSISLLFDKETPAKKTKNFSFRGKETFIKEKPIHQPSNRSALYIRNGFSCNLYSSGFKRALAKFIKFNKRTKIELFAFLIAYGWFCFIYYFMFQHFLFYLLPDGFSFNDSLCFSISLLFDKETLAKKAKKLSKRKFYQRTLTFHSGLSSSPSLASAL